MSQRPIVFYVGGFAQVGGIEAFARDFLLAVAAEYPRRELVMWGKSDSENELLNDIIASGATITRSPWRWGCVWRLPDHVLESRGREAVKRAAVVIFKRPPPSRILRRLKEFTQRKIPFVLITPYRPAEYWEASRATADLAPFDVIVVQSDAWRDDLRKFAFPGRIETIPLLPPKSYALAEFPSGRKQNTVRLGYLGRLVPQKNLGYLLDVFAALTRDRNPDRQYELHLFGDGSERTKLERRSREFAPRLDIYFHREVPRAQVGPAIDSCDLFLNTSLTEGQCLVALEVLSRGRPLVATPVGALPEILSSCALGRLATLDDAGAFAARVAEIADGIQAGVITPQSVAGAFHARYDYNAVRQSYLDLLADLGVGSAKIAA